MQPVPLEWKLSKETILQWANAWSSEELSLKEMVPKFVEVEEDEEMEDSDVRIKFSNGEFES